MRLLIYGVRLRFKQGLVYTRHTGLSTFFPTSRTAKPNRSSAAAKVTGTHLTLSGYAAPHPIAPTPQLLPGRCEKHLAGHRAAALFMAKASFLSQQRRHPSAFVLLSQPLPPQPYPPFHFLLPSSSLSLTFPLSLLYYTQHNASLSPEPCVHTFTLQFPLTNPSPTPTPPIKIATTSTTYQLQSLHPIINHHRHHRFHHLFTSPSSISTYIHRPPLKSPLRYCWFATSLPNLIRRCRARLCAT